MPVPCTRTTRTPAFLRLLKTSGKARITKREEQEVGGWKDMPCLDSYGGVTDRLGALEMALTQANAAEPSTYNEWIVCLFTILQALRNAERRH